MYSTCHHAQVANAHTDAHITPTLWSLSFTPIPAHWVTAAWDG